jgi:hypothetical protein
MLNSMMSLIGLGCHVVYHGDETYTEDSQN